MEDKKTSPDDAAFLERAMRFLEDELSSQGTALFREELSRDPRLREVFMQICVGDTLVQEELASIIAGNPVIDEHSDAPDPPPSMHDTMVLPSMSLQSTETTEPDAPAAGYPDATPPQPSGWPWRKTGGIAALILLAITGFISFLSFHKAPAVADLSVTLDASWSEDSLALTVGQKLTPGTALNLKSGCANLTFTDGTTLILEGPAQLTLASVDTVELQTGKISVRMAHGRSGFVVVTPDSKVTDLGTEFGVIVDPAAHTTDVHVFLGRVQVAPLAATTPAQTLVRGGLAHVTAGNLTVTPEGNIPQLFIRDIATTSTPLEVADLLCGGDGSGERRGTVISPVTGEHGPWGTPSPWHDKNETPDRATSDGQYHRVSGVPVVDGTFVPDARAVAEQVDSAGHTFTFPATSGTNGMRLCVGGSVAPRAAGDVTAPVLGGVNYSTADHSYVVLNANGGLTFDLAAIRRIHPAAQLSRFHCTFGHYDPTTDSSAGKTDLFVLVDGNERFSRRGFVFKDGAIILDLPLESTDQFLTLACTDGGDGGDGTGRHDLLIGDAKFDLTGR